MGNMAQMVARGALANGTYSGDRAGLEKFAGLPARAPALAQNQAPAPVARTASTMQPSTDSAEISADTEEMTRRRNTRTRSSLVLGNEETLG